MNKLILLVEDNKQILYGNERMLVRRGYTVATALTLAEARRRLEEQTPDIIILDIMLPDGNGFDFLRELKQKSDIPVLLLTGLNTAEDTVRGLSEGGDDYLAKPYDFSVLLARIEALLRRSGRIPNFVNKGALQFDILASRAFLKGEDMLLSPKEFSLLLLMVQNEGCILSAEYLCETIWKQQLAADNTAVKTAISRLRSKSGGAFTIENDHKKRGYIFESVQS